MADVFRSNTVYLQLRVDTDPAIRIRQQFSSTPHAFSAQNAFTAVHGVPPGTVMPFAGSSVPYGWLSCNGASYAQADYPALFAAIGTTWGGSATNFNVPNLGGMIPVGVTSGHGLAATRGGRESLPKLFESPQSPPHLLRQAVHVAGRNGCRYGSGRRRRGKHQQGDPVFRVRHSSPERTAIVGG